MSLIYPQITQIPQIIGLGSAAPSPDIRHFRESGNDKKKNRRNLRNLRMHKKGPAHA